MARKGRLDQRITFQSYTSVPDGIAGTTKKWADLAKAPTVWADVSEGGGGEGVEADRVTATALTEFTIRNRSDIDERHRIFWAGSYYNIRQVPRQGRRDMYLTIRAERGVAQ